MLASLKKRLESIAGSISAAAQTHAKIVLLLAIAMAAGGLSYVKSEIGINTNTENMLSEKLAWRASYQDFKTNFPGFTDTIVVVVDAKTPDLVEDIARQLAARLAEDKINFHSVVHIAELEFFRRNQLLYLSEDRLQTMADQLSRSQAIISQLLENPSAERLLETLNTAYARDSGNELSALDTLNEQLATAVQNTGMEKFVPMSWQTLFDANAAKSGSDTAHRVIFTVKPVMDFSEILPAEPAINALRQAINTLEQSYPELVKIRITGSAALAHDEMLSVIKGSMKAGVFALLMVFACLYIGLRSWVLVLSTLVTLLIGLSFTATFAAAAVGTLNMISIAFAVLYVGLGVDFAIHTCLRYQESLKEAAQKNKFEILNSAVAYVGASISLCALTTAIGFFAFIPTDFKGVAELGLIAGVGMFVSLFTTLIVLPALLQFLPLPSQPGRLLDKHSVRQIITPQNAKTVLAIAGCLWFVSAISVSFVSFDINPLNLNDQQAESVKLIKELNQDGGFSLYSVSVLTDDRESAVALAEQLDELVSVASISSAEALVPDKQDAKFSIIDDLALIVGDELVAQQPSELVPQTLISELQKLRANLTAIANESETHLRIAVTNFLSQLESLDTVEQNSLLALLDKNLMASFSGRIERLNDGLAPSPVDLENLPKDLRELWISPENKFRVEITPRDDLSDNHFLKAFVQEIQGVVGDDATGTAVINVGAADAVQSAFIHAFCYALALISILLLIILRSFKEMIVTLFPLLLAGLITCAATVALKLPFNFANVIALPLLLGIGVDSAIHLLHRYKTEPNPGLGILQTSTARSVFFSAATTTVSFGNLAVSSHAGTASMGVMLSIGILSVLLCMLLILPAMLIMFVDRIPNKA